MEELFEKFVELNSEKRIFKIYRPFQEKEVLNFEKDFNIELPSSFRKFITSYAKGIHHKSYVLAHVLEKVSFKKYNKKSIQSNPSKPFPYTQRVYLGTQAQDFHGNSAHTTYIPENYMNKVYKEHSNGVIFLKDSGCLSENFIVVHGDVSGTVWTQNIQSNSEILPFYTNKTTGTLMNFEQYMQQSLERALAWLT
jgi:hypothetical protein